jgi:predicted phage tail protein
LETKSGLALLATSAAPSYQDTSFEFGKSYLYIVRSVLTANGLSLESDDSQHVIVTPRDIFPPAAPQGLVAALLPGATPESFVVELSWSISLETDLAGYRVYRSEQENVRGQLLTAELLLAPAYRDTSVEPGHHYWYTVTAVDHAGNESAPSAAVAIDITQLLP